MSTFWSNVRPEIGPFAKELVRRFHSKCAYCESFIPHVVWPNIEHFRPKGAAEFEQYAFAWENWLVSCQICNSHKHEEFPLCNGEPCLVNPCEEDPAQHLRFEGCLIFGQEPRGTETIRVFHLSREDLYTARNLYLLLVEQALNQMARTKEEKTSLEHQQARQLVIWAMQPEAPFAAMTRHYVGHRAPKLAHPATPHPYVPFAAVRALVEKLADQYSDKIIDLD